MPIKLIPNNKTGAAQALAAAEAAQAAAAQAQSTADAASAGVVMTDMSNGKKYRLVFVDGVPASEEV